MLSKLLDEGADVDTPNQHRSTPLLYAAKKNQLDVAAMLIERGARVGLCNDSKTTALHCAASSGHLAMCQLLVAKGADLRAEDEDSDTPLCVATEGGWQEVIAFLTQVRLAQAEAELRTAMESGDSGKLAVALVRAEGEEVVGTSLLSEASARQAGLHRSPSRVAASTTASQGGTGLAGAAAAAKELAEAKRALEAASERLRLEGEAHKRRLLVAAVTGAIIAVGLLTLAGGRRQQR